MALNNPTISVPAAEARFSTLPQTLSDDYRKRMGELLELTPEQKKRIKGWLKARIKEWRGDTDDLHQRLIDDNDLVEGQVMESDYPWEGASNVHIPVTEMYMEVYKSVEKRSILGADLIWYGETSDDTLRDILADAEDMLNYKARYEWNIEACLSNVFWTTNRDGLGVIQATWCEEYEPSHDILIITGEQDFLAEFGTADDAGLDEIEYSEYLAAAREASPEMPLEIPIDFEKPKYLGVKGEVVELVNFVIIPAWAPDIDHELCRGYGKRYYTRGGVIRNKMNDEVWYEESCTKVLKGKGKLSSINEFTQAQDEIDGINRTNLEDNYEMFEIVATGRLDGKDGVDEKFIFTYSEEHDELMAAMYYFYRIDYMALFKINERPNRLIGRSIPQKTRDINDEIDTQHNQRINVRTIGTVPSFKGQKSKKADIDGMLKENKWRPGVVFWLDDFNTFDQFKVQPTDLGESLAEENNDFKILDQYLGSAIALMSGGAAPGDPNAPGNKTAMMIQQSNLRMDDPLSELRRGVSKLGDICLSHLYQFGPPILQWQAEAASQGGRARTQTKTLHKKFLRQGIKMNMAGVTVTQNPDTEMQKGFQLHQALLQEPLYNSTPQLRVEGLRAALRAGRVPGRNRLLPSVQEVEQIAVETQKKAMEQMQMQKMVAMKQQQDAQLKARMDGARKQIQMKQLAHKMAEHNLAIGPGGAPGAQPAPAPQPLEQEPAFNGAPQ